MNAINFIRQHGIVKAKQIVEGAPDGVELFHTNTYLKNAHSEGKTDHFARWSDGFNDWINASADRDFIDSSIDLLDLKRLIESVDSINKFGGIALAKAYDKQMIGHGFDPFFGKAISDYEAIYSIPESVRQAILNLDMHL